MEKDRLHALPKPFHSFFNSFRNNFVSGSIVLELNAKRQPVAENNSGDRCEPASALIPSPRQTGRGSGRGVRFLSNFNLAQIRWNKLLFPGVFHYLNTAGSLSQRIPNFQQTSLVIPLPLMVPEPERFDAAFCQILFARFVALNSFRQTVLKTVKFDVQLRISAIKIQDMSADHVLPPKFETGESPSAQGLPKFSFLVGLSAAKIASNLRKTHTGKMQIIGKNSSSSPRPSPRLARRG